MNVKFKPRDSYGHRIGKKGSINRRIIASADTETHERNYHATKGWRVRRK